MLHYLMYVLFLFFMIIKTVKKSKFDPHSQRFGRSEFRKIQIHILKNIDPKLKI